MNQKVCEEMNLQIRYELESAYLYLSMAAWLESHNLDGMAHWMRCQAHEETIHAMLFFGHIVERGGKVVLANLDQRQTDWVSPAQLWEDTYKHEQFVTSRIHTIMKVARAESDFAAEPMLSWFIKEQIEEEANTSKIAEQLARIADSKEGIMILDKDLAARIYPAGSPFDPIAIAAATGA